MTFSFKSKKSTIVAVLMLILVFLGAGAFSYYESQLQRGTLLRASVPEPPLVEGCYEYTHSQGWQIVNCLSPEYVRTHVPPPQVSPFAQGVVGLTSPVQNPLNPVTYASVYVNLLLLPQVIAGVYPNEFDSITGGPSSFSIQLNTNYYTGRSGHTYWDQFAVQNFIDLPGADSSNCSCNGSGSCYCRANVFGIWEIDVTVACNWAKSHGIAGCGGLNNPGYFCKCFFITSQVLQSGYVGFISANVAPAAGTRYGNLVSIAILGDGTFYAAVWPDLYGLSTAGHWQQVSGTILGAGGGSQAQFPTPTVLMTTVTAGFGGLAGIRVPYSDQTTAETNNLGYVGSSTIQYPDANTAEVSTLAVV